MPHFYIYILVHKTIGTKGIAKLIVPSIVFLACLFPFVDTAGEYIFAIAHKGFLWFTYLNVIVGYYAEFVLYMFLFILAFGIIQLINRIIRFVPPGILKSKTVVLVTILATMFSGVTILVIGTYINNDPVIKRYAITIPKRSSTLNSLKIISVSDLHLKNITSIKFLKNLVNKIQETNPEIIFVWKKLTKIKSICNFQATRIMVKSGPLTILQKQCMILPGVIKKSIPHTFSFRVVFRMQYYPEDRI